MRRLLRWGVRLALGLLVLSLVAVVAAILLADNLAREILVRRLQSKTGLEVKISAVHVGLLSPTMTIERLQLYNTPDFGGALCLDLPEIQFKYDPSALLARRLHFTRLRLDLKELSVVQDKNGRSNFDTLTKKKKGSARRKASPDDWKFSGIDEMDITLGSVRLSSLATGRKAEFVFGLKHQILRPVNSEADLAPLGVAMLLRGKATSPDATNVNLGQWIGSLLGAP